MMSSTIMQKSMVTPRRARKYQQYPSRIGGMIVLEMPPPAIGKGRFVDGLFFDDDTRVQRLYRAVIRLADHGFHRFELGSPLRCMAVW